MASVANSTGIFNVRHRCWAPFWGLGVRLWITRNDCSIDRCDYTTWHVHLAINQAVYRMLDLASFINLSLSIGPRTVHKHSGPPAWEWHVANDGTAIVARSATIR